MMRALLPFLAFLALWQVVVAAGLLPTFVLPGPLAVAQALRDNAGLLARHAGITLLEVLAGLALGATLGAAMAIAMQIWPRLGRLAGPVLSASQAVPVFVLAPVLTIWFGYGLAPKVAMAVLLVFFPVAESLREGMAALPAPVQDLARIARAQAWREMLWLRLPHAVPHLRAGLLIGATYAPTGAVIGEWVGASRGLGYLMLMANARSRTDLMFAALVLVVVLTLALRAAVGGALRRIA